MSVSIQIVYLLSVIGAIGINLHLLSVVLRRPDQIISRYLIVVFSISVSVCTAWLGLSLATSAETALFWTRLRLVIFALAPAIYANTLFILLCGAAPMDSMAARHPAVDYPHGQSAFRTLQPTQ